MKWLVRIGLLVVLGFFAVKIMNSPEVALYKIAKDIEESGMEGLKPHLVDDAETIVNVIDSVSNNVLVQGLASLVTNEEDVTTFVDHLQNMEWELADIDKSSKRAVVTIYFIHEQKLEGFFDIDMRKIDDEWKISDFELHSLEWLN